jgi:hypothetical protein
MSGLFRKQNRAPISVKSAKEDKMAQSPCRELNRCSDKETRIDKLSYVYDAFEILRSFFGY